MDIRKLKNILEQNNQPEFRLKQILKSVYQNHVLNFSDMSNLPKNLRETLTRKVKILPFSAEKILTAKNKKSAKAILKLDDGDYIETVLISVKRGLWSVCVSCQAGCPNACEFCATGQGGFKRNLTAEEITDQVLFWQEWLEKDCSFCEQTATRPEIFSTIPVKKKISNIIYMGMGEPFLNWENVKISLRKLTDREFFNYSDRSISVSTVGIPDGIKKLAKEFPQINLAISLHSAVDEKRSALCPINKKFSLAVVKKALDYYLEKTSRKVFLEYVMISQANDNIEDAKALIKYINSFSKPYLLHVNLIKYNDAWVKFKGSADSNIISFLSYLSKNKVSTTIRRSLGAEIKGACGQLGADGRKLKVTVK